MKTRSLSSRLAVIDTLRGITIAALPLLCIHTASAQQATTTLPAEQRITVQGQKNPSVWFKAESQHFVVYSDASQPDVAELLHNMERLDFLLRVYTSAYFKAQPREPKLTLYYHNKVGALAEHGRAGVPLYLVYPKGGGEPTVLPQLLTEGLVIEAVEKAAKG